MLHIELAQYLDDFARGALSDALTRGANTPLAIISVTQTLQTARPRTRREAKPSTTIGTHAFLLDEHTAAGLARSGLLIRPARHDSFISATAHGIALQRTRNQLESYLEIAEQIIADYANARR